MVNRCREQSTQKVFVQVLQLSLQFFCKSKMYVKINSENKQVKLLRGELAVEEARWEQGEVRWGRGCTGEQERERWTTVVAGPVGGRGGFEGTDLRTC